MATELEIFCVRVPPNLDAFTLQKSHSTKGTNGSMAKSSASFSLMTMLAVEEPTKED